MESFALPDALKSSGDTMEGALKLDGGIKQQTSADLSGTYADHQFMLSDSFSVTGDVTISDNLILSKLSDDGNAITLTNDTSTRTITGTGSLETSTLAQTPNASLSGMTGTIDTAVNFPSGHVIQVVSKKNTTSYSSTSGSWTDSGIFITITPKLANSYIHLMGTLYVWMSNNAGYGGCSFKWKRSQSGQTDAYPIELDDTNGTLTNDQYSSHWNQASWYNAEFSWIHPFTGIDKTSHTAGAEITYALYQRVSSMDGMNIGASSNPGVGSNFSCHEIVI